MTPSSRFEGVKSRYRFSASWYDALVSMPTLPPRRLAILRLALQPGDVALDFGCGSGLSFSYLEKAVGPNGHIIGVDLSPELIAQARDKAERHGWTNITLIEGNAEEVDLPGPVDGVLSMYTHVLMNSLQAVDRALAVLKPGGRFAVGGLKRAEGLRGIPLNLYTIAYGWPFITVKAMVTLIFGRAVPWAYVWDYHAYLEKVMGPMDVQECVGGAAYVAWGVKRET